MKKVKTMLISFALLTIVGGALAFKAKYGPLSFCYTTTNTQNSPCSLIENVRQDPICIIIYTTPSVYLEGVGFQCTKEADKVTPLTCTTPITIITNLNNRNN
jgi:hypothetical protein